MTHSKDIQSKSIFDEKFHYLKIPIEVFKIPGLSCAQMIILSIVIYWTKRGMPCTYTNLQFGELIRRSESTAKREISSLIKRRLLDAFYRNDHKLKRKDAYRELTALAGVSGQMIFKRKAAQLARAMGNKDKPSAHRRPGTTMQEGKEKKQAIGSSMSRSSGHLCPSTSGHGCAGTTIKTISKLLAPTPCLPDGQASALENQEYSEETLQIVNQVKEKLGIGREIHNPLSEEEFEKRRARQKKQLEVIAG